MYIRYYEYYRIVKQPWLSLPPAPLKIGFPFRLSGHPHLKLTRHQRIFELVDQPKLRSCWRELGTRPHEFGALRRPLALLQSSLAMSYQLALQRLRP
jgi:hypothetical protein